MELQKRRFDYKWVILAACFLMEFICLGFCSSNAGLYTGAVTRNLDIPRSLYSIGSSIRYVVQVITALFFGTLIQKFGAKKMVAVGLSSLTASVLIRSVATNIVHIYIGFALWGLGIVFSGGTMASTIVRRWFHKDIGKYTGIVMSANGVGGAIAAQIISPIINNGQADGYRKAYLLSGILTLIVSAIVLLCLRENPADSPASTEVGKKKKARGQLWSGIAFSEVKKRPYFYLTFLFIFLTGISMQSVGTISVVYMEDLGFDARFVATTATVSSLVLTFAKIFMGFTYDKKGLRFTLVFSQLCVIIGFLLKATLNMSGTGTLGMVCAMTATVLGTIALPLETVMIPLISNDLFGTASYDKVLGIFYSANSLGLCLGSPLCDLYRDLTGGSYASCYWFFIGLMAVVLAGFQLIIRAAHKDKMRILEEQEKSAV
jgi:MFS family permease